MNLFIFFPLKKRSFYLQKKFLVHFFFFSFVLNTPLSIFLCARYIATLFSSDLIPYKFSSEA